MAVEFASSSRTIQSVPSTVASFLTPFLITPAVRSVTIFRSPGKHSSRSAPNGSVANHYLDGAGTTSTHAVLARALDQEPASGMFALPEPGRRPAVVVVDCPRRADRLEPPV